MLAARYHETVVLLHTMDGKSPRTIAGRFGANEDEVRAVLIAAGALGGKTSSASLGPWRNSLDASQVRIDRRVAPAPQYASEDERADLALWHVNAVIRALGGQGFPYFELVPI